MRYLVQSVVGLFLCHNLSASIVAKKLPQAGVVAPENNHFIDPEANYREFTGRVSDKDDRGRIFKVQVENNNTKFFRVGDTVYFSVGEKKTKNLCKGFVRSTEDFYFSMYVENLSPCFPNGEYFKRGTLLSFESDVLLSRVYEASKYREQLIIKKEHFLSQLNEVNHYIWSFDQIKVKTAADYDQQIVEFQKARQKALDNLIQEKHEKLVMQNELMKKLNEMDDHLKFYRIERQELLTDRWNMDHDNGLPYAQRPQENKKE